MTPNHFLFRSKKQAGIFKNTERLNHGKTRESSDGSKEISSCVRTKVQENFM